MSTDETDAGFQNWSKNTCAKVTLDGVAVENCDLADEELGLVRVLKKNEAGQLFLDGDELATEFRHGVVRILLRSNEERGE
jgi:hypothetical protein